MTPKFRMLIVGAASLVTLVFAGAAFAAFTPTFAIGQTPPTAGSSATSFRLTVPRDDDALFKASFYVPAGYTATLGQAPGTQLGTVAAQVLVREPIAGAVLPLTGTVVVTDQATVGASVAQCTQTLAAHAGYWVLVLQAAGQELRVPIVIDPAPAALASVASYVMQVCLPSPHIPVSAGGATFGAKLIQAQINLSNVLSAPSSGGTYRWHAVTTPWPNGPGLPNVAGTVSAQGTAALPGAVSLVGEVEEARPDDHRTAHRGRPGHRRPRSDRAGRRQELQRSHERRRPLHEGGPVREGLARDGPCHGSRSGPDGVLHHPVAVRAGPVRDRDVAVLHRDALDPRTRPLGS